MLIGLVGEKGVGKDAAAEILCLNRGFQRFAFGDALKREVDWAILYGISREERLAILAAQPRIIGFGRAAVKPEGGLYLVDDSIFGALAACQGQWPKWWQFWKAQAPGQSPYEKPYSFEMRRLLQLWGTEYRRNQNPNYWVDILKDQVRESLVAGANIVISDVRFANEIEMIWGLGGKIWQIKRLNAWHEVNRDAASDHRSENEWKSKPRNHSINNYGDLAMLERRVLREHDRINPYWKEA